jgi:hypothetical protein
MLFSTSPDAEAYLKDELWGCFKHIKIPFDILYKMPTRDRKYYIKRHNDEMSKEQNDAKGSRNRNELGINGVAKAEQQRAINASKRGTVL